MTKAWGLIAAMTLATLTAVPARAIEIAVNAVDSGAYKAPGLHTASNENYLTGVFRGAENRSFFVFDLPALTGTIHAATLRLFNPEVSPFLHGYVSPDPTETLDLYAVSTSPADLIFGAGGAAAFDDLGSGALYRSRVVSASDNGRVVEIALGAAALADLNAARGRFAVGGALGTLGTGDQYVFGFSMAPFVQDQTRQLLLEVRSVAEPHPAALLAAAVALVGVNVARRRRTSAVQHAG
jgi:hypothetical protein